MSGAAAFRRCGDINAEKERIGAQDILKEPRIIEDIKAAAGGGGLSPLSSSDEQDRSYLSSSDAEDTDEELSICRSYDVTPPKESEVQNAAKEVEGDLASSPPPPVCIEGADEAVASSTSESDTDEDKHVSRKYDITRASSSSSCSEVDLEENKRHAKEDSSDMVDGLDCVSEKGDKSDYGDSKGSDVGVTDDSTCQLISLSEVSERIAPNEGDEDDKAAEVKGETENISEVINDVKNSLEECKSKLENAIWQPDQAVASVRQTDKVLSKYDNALCDKPAMKFDASQDAACLEGQNKASAQSGISSGENECQLVGDEANSGDIHTGVHVEGHEDRVCDSVQAPPSSELNGCTGSDSPECGTASDVRRDAAEGRTENDGTVVGDSLLIVTNNEMDFEEEEEEGTITAPLGRTAVAEDPLRGIDGEEASLHEGTNCATGSRQLEHTKVHGATCSEPPPVLDASETAAEEDPSCGVVDGNDIADFDRVSDAAPPPGEAEAEEEGAAKGVSEDEEHNVVTINVDDENDDSDDVNFASGDDSKRRASNQDRFRFGKPWPIESPVRVSHSASVGRRGKVSPSGEGGDGGGLSSSSSDVEASDSADTVIDASGERRELSKGRLGTKSESKEESEGSGGASCANSLSGTCEGESQFSEGSDEGNLVSIVSVGEERKGASSCSQGGIYINADGTNSNVHIRHTCIVLNGAGNEVPQEGVADDITILEVNRDRHVMSVRVTSPESSRSASPSCSSSAVSELQSLVNSAREAQLQLRRSQGGDLEGGASSLANYFTLTLGTDSPHTPRRFTKTPEIKKRRSVEILEAAAAAAVESPSSATPVLSPTPDHSEGDLLAYEESHGIDMEQPFNSDEDGFDAAHNSYESDSYLMDKPEEFCDIEFPGEFRIEPKTSSDFEFLEGTLDPLDDAESNYSESSGDEYFEKEEELRGYCNRAIDFSLPTILEESCEESDYEKRPKEHKRDPSELEKYFCCEIGNVGAEFRRFANEESECSDSFSETSSSVFSEGVDSLEHYPEEEVTSSTIEKYFRNEFVGFERQPSIRSTADESEVHTDESGSVGSDSEGSPSPEQPRRKLLRHRGFRAGLSSRSHSSSDKEGEGALHAGGGDGDDTDKTLISGDDDESTESEETAFDKVDGQVDTIKKRKKKKVSSSGGGGDLSDRRSESDKSEFRVLECEAKEDDPKAFEIHRQSLEHLSGFKGDSKEKELFLERGVIYGGGGLADRKCQSRDSGFVGSSDDLLRERVDEGTRDAGGVKGRLSSGSSADEVPSAANDREDGGRNSSEGGSGDKQQVPSEGGSKAACSHDEGKVSRSSTGSSGDLPAFSRGKDALSRKDSFNNWSSDEETNLMMNKMRSFFRTMILNSSRVSQNSRSSQLVQFEAKLTNLMQTVPGINDEQVKEIVGYLSSEETWSDSYDSSDHANSDLEGAHQLLDPSEADRKSLLDMQISEMTQRFCEKYNLETASVPLVNPDCDGEEGTAGSASRDAGVLFKASCIFGPKPDSEGGSVGSGSQGTSPPLLTKVMRCIGDRLVAWMHEVSGGSEDAESLSDLQPVTSSPRARPFALRKQRLQDFESLSSPLDKSPQSLRRSLSSPSCDSEGTPTDTEQSPKSSPGAEKREADLPALGGLPGVPVSPAVETKPPFWLSQAPKRTSPSAGAEDNSGSRLHQLAKDAKESWPSLIVERDSFERTDRLGFLKRSNRRAEARKARSHMSLEKIHQEYPEDASERSESLGDLLDRVNSSGFSSSYEQLDSDSTLKASDSLDRHIGSSSSNIRLNASSRGSLTTSSRGSLATSSRGSLNAGSKGSLHGSSGPEEDEEERKFKKPGCFKQNRRPAEGAEMRSTTLPRSAPTQPFCTDTLPRSLSSQVSKVLPAASALPHNSTTSSSSSSASALLSRSELETSGSAVGAGSTPGAGPRSARYHAPGYRPPPSTTTRRSSNSRPSYINSLKSDDSSPEDGLSNLLPKSGTPSPLVGSVGRTSGRSSEMSLNSSDASQQEEEIERLFHDKKRPILATLGSRSESLASVCSTGAEGRYGTVAVRGELQLGLQYNYKEGQLEVHVVQCQDLAAVDTKRNRSDPYVKVYLLPDKTKTGKRKTKVKKHTLNPVFEEVLKFNSLMRELDSRTIWASVWHSDMFGRNDFLGEVKIPLGGESSIFDDPTPKWYTLQDRCDFLDDFHYNPKGDLILAMKFVPPDVSSKRSRRSKGSLQVLVKEAKNLVVSKPYATADPVCKGLLLPEKGKSSKQKTRVCRKTLNPTWHDTLVFIDVSLQELTERCLELSVWDHDRLGSSQFLGGCRLNLGKGKQNGKHVDWMDASGMEVKLWEQMLERPNLWVEGAIMMRSSMDKPVYSSTFTE